jgi:hypothetical protein
MDEAIISVAVGAVLLLVLQVMGLAWYWALAVAFAGTIAARMAYRAIRRVR